MSLSAPRTGWWFAAERSRRTGVRGSPICTSTPTPATTAATRQAQPGEAIPTTTPATPGPIACETRGRTMPSKPLTASRSDAGTIAGSQAEYAA